MGPIWVKIYEQYKALKQAGMPSYECERRAIPPMTRAEAIAALHEAIQAVQGYSDEIRGILGWQRDPDCTAQLAMNNKCIQRYQKELQMYDRLTDEKFRALFPTLVFRSIATDLHSLDVARNTLVTRGPRYNPR
jgi:hypothetical protein